MVGRGKSVSDSLSEPPKLSRISAARSPAYLDYHLRSFLFQPFATTTTATSSTIRTIRKSCSRVLVTPESSKRNVVGESYDNVKFQCILHPHPITSRTQYASSLHNPPPPIHHKISPHTPDQLSPDRDVPLHVSAQENRAGGAVRKDGKRNYGCESNRWSRTRCPLTTLLPRAVHGLPPPILRASPPAIADILDTLAASAFA